MNYFNGLWREPSGDPFNSLVQLEYESGIPRNPFINAGAIVVADSLISGVGGGIVAVVPGKLAIAVYSPELNKQGNSLIGTQALELFTTKTGLSIF